MDKIIISDTAFIGPNYDETIDGINKLKILQNEGLKIIVLSNRPELCMRKIGIYINKNGDASYRYLGACEKKGNGVDLIIHDDEKTDNQYNIKPEFSIFGNGICAFDKNDILIYQGSFLTPEELDKMIKIFRDNHYVSYDEYGTLRKDSYGDRCFQGDENVYKFFAPEIGSSTPDERTYGMQCSSRGPVLDNKIIHEVESNMPEIVGYILNGKPCFYQRNVNKLVALNNISDKFSINISNSLIILSEKTDKVILDKYPNSECVGDLAIETSKSNSNSLAKILKRII